MLLGLTDADLNRWPRISSSSFSGCRLGARDRAFCAKLCYTPEHMRCVRLIFRMFFCAFVAIITVFAQNSAWYIDTIAGTDRPVNDGGPGTKALLNQPSGVVVDAGGNVIFADSNNHRVRKVAPDGTISTIVGTGVVGNSGDSGPALAAQMIAPNGVAVDQAGNLYVSDFDANVVRKVTPSGTITTIAGTGFPSLSGDNGPAVSATLNGPSRMLKKTSAG